MMKNRLLIMLWFTLVATGYSAQSIYCPQNHGFINIGMSQQQVINACGQPLSKQQSNQPLMQKIPVLQLFYNNQGSTNNVYGIGANQISNYAGFNQTLGNTGVQLQIDIVDNKVISANINSSSTNAFSICGGTNIQVGDPVAKVYQACGNPAITNNSYLNKPVQNGTKPDIWLYQPGQYQTALSLTFVDGKLQSINQ